jgi:hypothetical protein
MGDDCMLDYEILEIELWYQELDNGNGCNA